MAPTRSVGNEMNVLRAVLVPPELAGRLDVTQGAISELEHSDDVRLSTLRQYLDALDALGARLELVAVSDDEDRRVVPIHLGRDSAG